MPVSKVLENSAIAFNVKYACNFDFAAFESRVEEFTFLRPNGGWIDVYKVIFDRMYKSALEKAAVGAVDNLNGEAMLDDFEYTLIRPYVSESNNEIKHQPYVGMDRITRLEYLDRITKEAPRNPVDLYSEKYKRGELSLRQMKAALGREMTRREHYIEIAGYIQALENINKNRSFMWRACHPFKNNAEKRDAVLMKESFLKAVKCGDDFYNEIAAAAYETFDGCHRADANLTESMVRAKEETNRQQKMNDALREVQCAEGFGNDLKCELSLLVDQNKLSQRKNEFEK